MHLAAGQVHDHLEIGFRIAEAVDADTVATTRQSSLQQRLGGGQAHLLDVLVDRGVLLDEGVGGRHVGLGLVVVVVGDEVLDRVVREELAELAVQLRGQGLVVGHDDRRALQFLTTCAMVKVLPEPVTPSSVCAARPA
jgi:hypothetical protein